MKLEIDLDLDKIDYDSINKQIKDKIAVLNIKDEYEIRDIIESKINWLLDKEVDEAYGKYIADYWSERSTCDGRNLVQSITKEKIEERIRRVMDKVFETNYDEETINKLISEVAPEVFTAVLFDLVNKKTNNSIYENMNRTMNRVNSMIHSAFNNRCR